MASALLVRSVSRMLHAPTGVIADGVVTATMQLPARATRTGPRSSRCTRRCSSRSGSQPGVERGRRLDVACRSSRAGGCPSASTDAPRRAGERLDRAAHLRQQRLLRNRCARRSLQAGPSPTTIARHGEPVVIVNQTFARRAFPGEDAIGKRLVSTAQQIGPLGRNLTGPVPFRIVGVVADIHQAPLGRRGEPVIYHTPGSFPSGPMTIAARGAGHRAAVTGAMRTALRALDPTLALSNVRTMDERFMAATAGAAAADVRADRVRRADRRRSRRSASTDCSPAMVNERRRELAIRLALGAQPGALARLVTTQGLDAGRCSASSSAWPWRSSRGGLLQSVLFETRTTDIPGADDAPRASCSPAAALACLAPALRAAHVPASEGLKIE